MRKHRMKTAIAGALLLAMVSALSLSGCGGEPAALPEVPVSSTAAAQLPQFQVRDAVGSYATIDKQDMADAYSEEISDLVNGKHLLDEAFDDTEYATTIDDPHSGSWGIYIYMCGSDLESEHGAATNDLAEIFDAALSEDVRVVLQTGGSTQWQNDIVDPNYLERYVFDADGMELADRQSSASMGRADTLADFLSYCDRNYPADNQMVIFWNHGGGSLGGVCYDEIYDFDHLTLNEIDEAFTSAWGTKRIAGIGFDCCLMASVDTANICKNHAEMMIASEEIIPGNGWHYIDWLTKLSENPAMSSAQLGKTICDSYLADCAAQGTADTATLSVIDLNKINLVVDGMNLLSAELFSKVVDTPSILTMLGRAADQSENYGGNTDATGYFNLVDIGDFLAHTDEDSLQAANTLASALDLAVVYRVAGDLRSQSTGLAMYYPYDKSLASQQKYEAVAASDLYAGIHRLMITGDITPHTLDLLASYYEQKSSSAQPVDSVSTDNLSQSVEEISFAEDTEDLPVVLDENGYLVSHIPLADMQHMASITAELLFYLEDAETFLSLGVDNDVAVNWDDGVIRDNFRGVWPCLDGHYLYLNLTYEGEDYNLYDVPILCNGDAATMTVAYDYETGSYWIVGLSDAVDTTASNQCAARETRQLQPGDEITTIFYYFDFATEDWEPYPLETFRYTEDSAISEDDLGDGEFALMFMATDAQGNTRSSDYGYISYRDGNIDAYI